jgi:hypothetical protein
VVRRRASLDKRAAGALALIGLLTLACQGQPVPLAAAQGTTVTIPIGGGGFNLGDGVRMGYGSDGDLDYQRGRLRFWLDVEPGPDVELTVRGIARVSPDPSSRAGLNLGADYEHSGQVVVMVDIPTTAPIGTWYVYARRFTYQWNSGTSTWDEQEDTVNVPSYQYQLEILPELGSPTPFEGYAINNFFDVSEEVLDFKPLPKFRFMLAGTAGVLGAAQFTITYPSARAAVRAVLAEPLSDTDTWAAQALISYTEPTPGTLDVSCVAPAGVTGPAFAIVFELTNPTAPPPVGGALSTADFVISGVQAWNLSGTPVSPSVPSGQKAIY